MPVPTSPYRFDHVHLRSRDAIAAAGFYIEMLGAREISRDGAPVVSRVTIDLGGVSVFIEQAPDDTTPSAEPPYLGIEHIGLCVEDVDAARADLQSRGVTFVSDVLIRTPTLRVTFLQGPDGALIELLERSDAP